MRSDTARNRRALIKAAGRLFAKTTDPVTMSDIDREAQVSTATAYRQFDSVEEVLSAFRHSVGFELRDYAALVNGAPAAGWPARPAGRRATLVRAAGSGLVLAARMAAFRASGAQLLVIDGRPWPLSG
jgi:AcrR family transcriptional regulator